MILKKLLIINIFRYDQLFKKSFHPREVILS
jgi:hypothetical protein